MPILRLVPAFRSATATNLRRPSASQCSHAAVKVRSFSQHAHSRTPVAIGNALRPSMVSRRDVVRPSIALASVGQVRFLNSGKHDIAAHCLQASSLDLSMISQEEVVQSVISQPTIMAPSSGQLASLINTPSWSSFDHAESTFWPLVKVQETLHYFHEGWGLPWWGSIVTLTVLFRLAVLPVNISLVRNAARLNMIRPLLIEKVAEYKDPALTDSEKRQKAEEILDVFKTHKCNPFWNIAPPFMIAPLFLTVFFGVEGILLHDPTCHTGGTLWFPNLSVPDATWTLPVMSAVTWMMTLRFGTDRARGPLAATLEQHLSYVSLAMIPITQPLPTGAFVYWITSNTFTLVQIFLLRRKLVRHLLSIPPPQGPPSGQLDLDSPHGQTPSSSSNEHRPL
eukprot:Opistho-2@4599